MTPPLDVTVVAAQAGEQAILRHLADLYAYDFSALLGLDVREDGRFPFHDLTPYFTDGWRHPFLVRVAGKLAGFVLVDDRSRLSGADGVHDVAEFFIMRKYRRQGIGERVAHQVFKRFPGPWEVRQRHENPDATAFWRRVIDRFTRGDFRETSWDAPAWQGPVQSFDS